MIPALLLSLAADRADATVANRDVVMEFATCVRRRAPDRAAALLRSKPGSDDEHRKLLVIGGAYGACIKDRRVLSFQPELLRGQFAELAFRDDTALRDRATALPALAPSPPDAAAIERAVGHPANGGFDRVYAVRFREAYARCVADADPKTTAALLQTSSASAEERQTVLHYGGTLMRCMPQGVTYHIIPGRIAPLPRRAAILPHGGRRRVVTDDRSQMMFDILLGIQADLGQIKREISSINLRVSALEDHFRGTLTTLYGIQADTSHLKGRVDRIERRLGLNEAEH